MNKTTDLEEQQNVIEKHPKQDFQVERLAFFSDAVFAIAITLLVIEFKIPHITKNSTYTEVLNQLYALKFNFIAILFSFFLISSYWIQHHFLFKHIHNYNKQIIYVNMLVLLPIIFFPFTTTFFAECLEFFYAKRIESPSIGVETNVFYIFGLRLFALNHFIASFMLYIFYWLATVRYKELSFKIETKERIKFVSSILFKTFFFGAIFVVTFFTYHPDYIVLIMFIALIFRVIIRKKYQKTQ